MEPYCEGQARSRVLKALLRGLIWGACVLLLLLTPIIISSLVTKSSQASLEGNLAPGFGDASEDFRFGEVTVNVLFDGKPRDGMSVSPNMKQWYSPQDGSAALSLMPGEYEFCAAWENRYVLSRHRVDADSPGSLEIDVSLAPEAPELLMLESPKGENREFLLDLEAADKASLQNPPNGLSLIRREDSFFLAVDGDLVSDGFHAVELISENKYGKAITWIGLRIPRGDAPVPIYTVKDLQNIRHNLSGSFILMNGLDMSEIDDWTPLGSLNYPFTGVFDGGGYEITGFHCTRTLESGESFSFLGSTRNAEIRNLIFRDPDITPDSTGDEIYVCSVIGDNNRGLVENCAVFGGRVILDDGLPQGAFSSNSGIMLGVFNSADVFCGLPGSVMPNVGGVAGANNGYCSYAANEGEVYGSHLHGGICGLHYGGMITRSVNSGYIWGTTLVGAFPPGGIVQTVNDGAVCAYGYFVRGQSASGGKSFSRSITNSLLPIGGDELRSPGSMPWLGSFEGGSFPGNPPDWTYASLDAGGPVPFGIFRHRAEAPVIEAEGKHVIVPHVEGLTLFYTLDGSDPRIFGQRSDSLYLALSRGQVLSVFSARQGFRDSELIIFDPEGGSTP